MINYNDISASRRYYRNLIKLNILISIITILILLACIYFEMRDVDTKIFASSQNGKVEQLRILGFN